MPKLSSKTRTRSVVADPARLVAEMQLQGFIDAANYRAFEKALDEAYASGAQFLVIDFTDVHYINSTGISALIRNFERYRQRGGTLCLAGVAKSVGLSMHLLGVTSLIPFSKDLAAAHEYVADLLAGKVRASPEAPPSVAAPRKVVVRSRQSGIKAGTKVLVITPATSRFTRVLRLRFKSLNGSYHLLHDTREALSRYAEIDPDLVVVDERCDPKGEFVNRLKVKKERSLTSVIKIYGKDRNVRADLDFKIWENDFLVDPFDTLELFSLTEAELLRVPRDRKVFVQQVHFEFKTTPANVDRANKLSEMILQHALQDSEEAMALYAAVKEGIDNAVVHGNRSERQRAIDVNFLVDHKKITVIIEDEGKGFDYEYYLARIDREEAFEEAKRRILEEGTRGGLGILLMSRCADRIDYSGTGNILRLEKNV